jgi:hypothetical protein
MGITSSERVAQKVLDWLREEGPITNSEIRKRLKERNIADTYVTFVLRRLRNMDLIRNVRKPVQLWFAVPMIDTDPVGPIDDVPQPDAVKIRKKSHFHLPPPSPWIHPIRRRALGLPLVGQRPKKASQPLKMDPGSPLTGAKR